MFKISLRKNISVKRQTIRTNKIKSLKPLNIYLRKDITITEISNKIY